VNMRVSESSSRGVLGDEEGQVAHFSLCRHREERNGCSAPPSTPPYCRQCSPRSHSHSLPLELLVSKWRWDATTRERGDVRSGPVSSPTASVFVQRYLRVIECERGAVESRRRRSPSLPPSNHFNFRSSWAYTVSLPSSRRTSPGATSTSLPSANTSPSQQLWTG
jgi:hypothetical protein